jgi:hypothetical protein
MRKELLIIRPCIEKQPVFKIIFLKNALEIIMVLFSGKSQPKADVPIQSVSHVRLPCLLFGGVLDLVKVNEFFKTLFSASSLQRR